MHSNKKKHKFIEHRLFNTGEKIAALLSLYPKPRILFPVKAIIMDVKYDEYNPKYLIKLTHFHDSFTFIKKNFIESEHHYRLSGTSKQSLPLTIINKVKAKEITSNEMLLNEFNAYENQAKLYYVVDSVMCTKTLPSLIEIFNKLQDYYIEDSLSSIKTYALRVSYTGQYKMNTLHAFNLRLRKFIGDLVKNDTWEYFAKYL